MLNKYNKGYIYISETKEKVKKFVISGTVKTNWPFIKSI